MEAKVYFQGRFRLPPSPKYGSVTTCSFPSFSIPQGTIIYDTGDQTSRYARRAPNHYSCLFTTERAHGLREIQNPFLSKFVAFMNKKSSHAIQSSRNSSVNRRWFRADIRLAENIDGGICGSCQDWLSSSTGRHCRCRFPSQRNSGSVRLSIVLSKVR